MQFRFIGEEMSDVFGFKWAPGTVHDVTEAHAVKKLSNHPMFEQADGAKAMAERFAPDEAVVEITSAKKPRKAKAAS